MPNFCALIRLLGAVLIGMLTWFIPRFTGIFAQFGGNLPYLTQVIIGASNVMKNYGLYVGAVVVLIAISVVYSLVTRVLPLERR